MSRTCSRSRASSALAERLVANSFADTVFFNNSGAEAVELSIKVARKYQSETGHPERYRVIGCHGSFHGRSFATLAAAGAEAYLKGFGPVMDGFDHVAFNNLNEMRAAVTDETAAILVEPVQGEGGVRAPSADYLKGLARDLRRVRPAAGVRRGAVRHGPHRQAVRA